MLYCCIACREADWSGDGMMLAYSHKVWCEPVRGFMAKTDLLRQLPFIFAQGKDIVITAAISIVSILKSLMD